MCGGCLGKKMCFFHRLSSVQVHALWVCPPLNNRNQLSPAKQTNTTSTITTLAEKLDALDVHGLGQHAASKRRKQWEALSP
mmetsp:Transcript_47090/g.77939  ORF Transcript_47090/g.77939 Transcript_47090/m.77939 type:complete len:81 (-) Transcript_47090:277-519(-)